MKLKKKKKNIQLIIITISKKISVLNLRLLDTSHSNVTEKENIIQNKYLLVVGNS